MSSLRSYCSEYEYILSIKYGCQKIFRWLIKVIYLLFLLYDILLLYIFAKIWLFSIYKFNSKNVQKQIFPKEFLSLIAKENYFRT